MTDAGPLLGAATLAVIHLCGGRLRLLNAIPRSRWLSIAGGVAVAFVLLHLLPELEEHNRTLDESSGLFAIGHRYVYLLTLLGFIVFYGLEKAARSSRSDDTASVGGSRIFWVHIASYSTYNLLIGYLLVREDRRWQSLVLFVIGIGLHFVVNDHGLYERHRQRYRRVGRWMLSAAVLAGWAVGTGTAIHEAITASVVAFLTGGILLNTFKEELPEERKSSFWAFAGGSLAYAGILLMM